MLLYIYINMASKEFSGQQVKSGSQCDAGAVSVIEKYLFPCEMLFLTSNNLIGQMLKMLCI